LLNDKKRKATNLALFLQSTFLSNRLIVSFIYMWAKKSRSLAKPHRQRLLNQLSRILLGVLFDQLVSGTDPRYGLTVAGRAATPQGGYTARDRIISAGYFKVMDIPLLKGRYFSEHDDEDAPRRFTLWLLSAFGGVALLLPAVGILSPLISFG